MASDDNGTLSIDLENWMKNLPDDLKTLPIINLAIPGTHDSMTYDMKATSPVAPDAEPAIHTLHKFIPCVIKRWAVTQKLSATDQLKNGVRYLDLRISYRQSDNQFYFVHGLYCEEINNPLTDVKIFLDQHPDEFVIMDCQHMYGFNHKNHLELIDLLERIFKNKIYERDSHLPNCTLKRAIGDGRQVLIIYRNNSASSSKFWYNFEWPTPWPNEIKVNKLKDYLEKSLSTRPSTSGYVSQCVLTPSIGFIVPRFFMSLRRACARPVSKKLLDWIKEQTPGPYKPGECPTVNVFLADFVDMKGSNFCKTVIDLNYKLLKFDDDDSNAMALDN